jgi:phage/plasmid-like protein (TIGR03299 family)
MSHGITERDSLVLANEPAWHGLGNVVYTGDQPGIESEKINELAGLTWTVEKVPDYGLGKRSTPRAIDKAITAYQTGRSEARFEALAKAMGFRPVERKYCIQRSDTGEMLASGLGEYFTLMQNHEVPLFLDALVAGKQAYYEVAGSIFGGRKVWWLMKLPRDIRISGDRRERIGQFIGVYNNHDGSGSVTIAVTGVRWVCNNTITYGLRTAKRTFKLKHTPGLADRFVVAREALGLTVDYLKEFGRIGDELANTAFSDGDFQQFLDDWMPLPEVKDPAASLAYKNTVANRLKVTDLYFDSPNLSHVRNTKYAALNAVSEFLDHHKEGRNGATKSAEESRFDRTVVKGDPMNDKALALLTK